MNVYEQEELTIKRDYLVVKSNQLVQKSRYNLSVTEQRVIAYICSMIKPDKPSPETYNVPFQLEYEFDIREYAKICGIHSDGGKLYEETKSILKGLKQKIMWLELPSGTEVTVAWLAKVWITKHSGMVKIKLDEDMVPYLFDLKNKFTAYGLINILALKSQYSIRIYELMQSYAYQKGVTLGYDKLKKILTVDDNKGYDRYNNFKQRILEPAMHEINMYTGLNINYETIKKGRKVDKIKFYISKKETFDRFIAHTKTSDEIR